MQSTTAIRADGVEDRLAQLDRDLAAHEDFGNSARIAAKVRERYAFGLELFAERLPSLMPLLPRIEPHAAALFRDPLIQLTLEAAFRRFEADTLCPPDPLERALAAAATLIEREGRADLALSQMRDRIVLAAGPWVWAFTPSDDPFARALERGFAETFPASRRLQLFDPESWMLERLERSFELLRDVLPRCGSAALSHIASICLVVADTEGGMLLSAAGGDPIPSTIFCAPDQLANPWDAAGMLLHEGLHLKLFDVVRGGSLVTPDPVLVEIPWRSIRWDIPRVIFSFHVYAHMLVFKAAVDRRGPALWSRFGAPDSYPTDAHATSVVRNATSRYGRAIDRARFLRDGLAGDWARYLTPDGHRLVQWLSDAMDRVEEVAP